MHEACHSGETEIVRLLLAHGGKTVTGCLSVLIIGVYNVLNLMYRHFLWLADPNKPDLLKGNTATHYAAEMGHADILKCLLRSGALPHLPNDHGQRSVDVASDIDCLQLLHLSLGEFIKE